jgi:hypothetical protein
MGLLSGLTDHVAGFFAHGAEKKQTKNALRAYDRADAASLGARDASVGYYQPFLQGGTQAFGNALAMTQPGFQYSPSDPSYGFRLNEGLNAVQRSAAAGGALHSGGTLKALNNYAQNVASTQYQNDFNNLATLGRFGLEGAQGSAQAQSGYADNLLRSAYGRSGIYKDRGEAIAKQFADGSNIVQDLGKIFGL